MVALNFPQSPNDGDTYNGYVYDATNGVWNADQGQIISRFSTSATQPASPTAGDGWLNPANGKTYVYYDGYWIESGNPVIGGVEPYDKRTTATGYFSLPSGTTAQRPDTPQNGDVRFNTTLGEPEYYNETWSEWFLFRQEATKINVQYLVVAGGGSGGYNRGGGGGAGGMLESSSFVNSGQSYSLSIGAGGAGTTSSSSSGSDSVFIDTAVGGGSGGIDSTPSFDGGSGGGNIRSFGGGSGGSGTAGQGNDGGSSTSIDASAGGGGKGSAGAAASGTTGSAGGSAGTNNYTGSSVSYAGGGGGWGASSGGAGGTTGGNGASGDSASGGNGTTNRGGGGGGGGLGVNGKTPGSGGSGIVILKYPSTSTISIGAGLTSSTSTVGDYKVTQFTAGSDTVSFS